jgi:hypothetical protein
LSHDDFEDNAAATAVAVAAADAAADDDVVRLPAVVLSLLNLRVLLA